MGAMAMVSIICPFHNERGNLAELIGRVVATSGACADMSRVELLMVDDGSVDGGADIVREWAGKHPWVKLLSHAEKRGQAAALSTGFRAAEGEVVITMDADLQVFPEDLPLLLQKMQEGYDLVNGVRAERKAGVAFKLSSAWLSFCLSFILKVPLQDAASNFMAVRNKFIKGLSLVSNDHRYLIPVICRRGASRVAEIRIRHQARSRGRSKYALFKAVTALPQFFVFLGRLKSGFYN